MSRDDGPLTVLVGGPRDGWVYYDDDLTEAQSATRWTRTPTTDLAALVVLGYHATGQRKTVKTTTRDGGRIMNCTIWNWQEPR